MENWEKKPRDQSINRSTYLIGEKSQKATGKKLQKKIKKSNNKKPLNLSWRTAFLAWLV